MPKYSVRRYWAMCDTVKVAADSIGQAIEKANARGINAAKAEYVPDSISSDPRADVEVIKKSSRR